MAFISTSSRATTVNRGRVSLLDLLSLYRQRRALARLDAHALQDLGLTRGEAENEAHRSFWDVPAHWRG
ncbi:MAG: DUF1127 domain-containing protein [Pseudomonadota bacterium]